MRNINLFDFVQKYRTGAKGIVRRTKDVIVRVIPRLKFCPDQDNEEYFMLQCKLRVPWINEVNELKPDDETWAEVYDSYAMTINDLNELNQYLDDDFEQQEEVELEEVREVDEHMAAARLQPIAAHNQILGERDVDVGYRWREASTSGYDVEQVAGFWRTLKQSYRRNRNDNSELHANPTIQLSTLQREALDICRNQLNDSYFSTKRVLVQGKAGTGKSAVIRAMCDLIDDRNQYQVLAPTGAAAINFDGKTLHSYLHIPNSSYSQLQGNALRDFQLQMRSIKFLIFDEYSMIGSRMLNKIHRRCCEATGKNEPFGGLNIWFFGDIRQLPPVKDLAVYSRRAGNIDNFASEGQLNFRSIQKFIFLETSFRQSADQQTFRDLLDNIAIGEITRSQADLLLTRRVAIRGVELESFKDAIRLFPKNADVNSFNERTLAASNSPVAKICGEHNNSIAKNSKDDKAQGLAATLYLTIGCRVMLRRNLLVEAGLVNGSLGTVLDIVYPDGRRSSALPWFILVKFDKYTGPISINGGIPISSISAAWKQGTTDCLRRQFPLTVAYALTIHKSQGLTLDQAVVEIGSKETAPGLTYVALSRVKTIEGLLLVTGYPSSRYNRISAMSQVKEKENLLRHMRAQSSNRMG